MMPTKLSAGLMVKRMRAGRPTFYGTRREKTYRCDFKRDRRAIEGPRFRPMFDAMRLRRSDAEYAALSKGLMP